MTDVVVVDENDQVVGTMPKDAAHKDGTPHRISVVYVENEKGEVLVQSRTDGYLDHSAAGHVDPGETYEEAALRELHEELGIAGVALERIGHGRTHGERYKRYPEENVSHVFDIFKCVAEPGTLQEEEVEDVYWADPEEIVKDMQKNPDKYCGGFMESLRVYLGAL